MGTTGKKKNTTQVKVLLKYEALHTLAFKLSTNRGINVDKTAQKLDFEPFMFGCHDFWLPLLQNRIRKRLL